MAARSRKQRDRRSGGTATAPRWTLWVVVLGLLLVLLGLLWAERVTGKSFLYGLVIAGGGMGLAAAALAAHLVGARLWRPGTTGVFAAITAGLAVGMSVILQITRPMPKEGPPKIVMAREMMLGVPIALAAFALVLGAFVAHRTIQLPPGGLAPRSRKLDLGTSVVALAGALFTLGPLFRSFGIPLNHWTFLGLVALATVAFLVVSLFERLLSKP